MEPRPDGFLSGNLSASLAQVVKQFVWGRNANYINPVQIEGNLQRHFITCEVCLNDNWKPTKPFVFLLLIGGLGGWGGVRVKWIELDDASRQQSNAGGNISSGLMWVFRDSDP